MKISSIIMIAISSIMLVACKEEPKEIHDGVFGLKFGLSESDVRTAIGDGFKQTMTKGEFTSDTVPIPNQNFVEYSFIVSDKLGLCFIGAKTKQMKYSEIFDVYEKLKGGLIKIYNEPKESRDNRSEEKEIDDKTGAPILEVYSIWGEDKLKNISSVSLSVSDPDRTKKDGNLYVSLSYLSDNANNDCINQIINNTRDENSIGL